LNLCLERRLDIVIKRIPPWPTVYPLNHPYLAEILHGSVEVTRMLKGLPLRFGRLSLQGMEHVLICGKTSILNQENPGDVYGPKVEYINTMSGRLRTGWWYQGIVTTKTQPNNDGRYQIVLFSVKDDNGNELEHDEVSSISNDLQVGVAPLVFHGPVHARRKSRDVFVRYIRSNNRRAVSGKENGFVVRNLRRDHGHGKVLSVLLGKF
jgi:hypothetical protein